MTTPDPAVPRRPRLLVLVVLAWVAGAALAIGGTFAPLYAQTESPSSSRAAIDTTSWVITSWHQTTVDHGREVADGPAGTLFGLPVVVAASVLFAAGLIGIGALLSGSDPGLRWAMGIAGVGAAVLLGAVGAIAMSVKAVSDQFANIDTTVGRSDYYSVQSGIGNGMWLLLLGAVLGVVAAAGALAVRHRVGPHWLRLPEPGPLEADDAPATPSFGVPVIRPVGYD